MASLKAHRIYSETTRQVATFAARVKLGRDVDAASEFAKWLLWSGIIGLLKETPQPPPLKCDGSLLEHRANELLAACNEFYATNRPSGLARSDVASLEEKVERLTVMFERVAFHVSKLPQAPQISITANEGAEGRGGGVAAPLPPVPPSLSKSHNCNEHEKPQ